MIFFKDSVIKIGFSDQGFPLGGGRGGHSLSDLSPPDIYPPPLSQSPPSKKFSRCVRTDWIFQLLLLNIILDQIQSPLEHNGI